MIRLTAPLLIAATFMVVIAGCKDDGPTQDVNPTLKFEAGSEYTYEYYERDSTDTRVDSTKQIVVWTVLRTGVDTLGRNSVTIVKEVRYDSTQTTAEDSTEVYLSIDHDGVIEQYDLFTTVLDRFSGGIDFSTYLNAVTKTWIKVCATKDKSSRSLQNQPIVQTATLSDIDLGISGVSTFDAKLELGNSSSHRGIVQTDVPAGSYSDAYTTDVNILLGATTESEITTPVPQITIPEGETIFGDTATFEYGADIEDGIVLHVMHSKAVSLFPDYGSVQGLIPPVNVNGYEMKLMSAMTVEAE